MELKTSAMAGIEQSNDIVIEINPARIGTGISISLESPVKLQFGRKIESVIRETLTAHGITDALVRASDLGALDFTVRARVLAALFRAGVLAPAAKEA